MYLYPRIKTQNCFMHTDKTLKGLGNIVQMRDSGSKVVTSMLDVQLKII